MRRHPASGYVQGINDLVTPFLAVFLSEHVPGSIDGWDLSTVPPERMLEVGIAFATWSLQRLSSSCLAEDFTSYTMLRWHVLPLRTIRSAAS